MGSPAGDFLWGVCVCVVRGGGLNMRSSRYVSALCFHMASTGSTFIHILKKLIPEVTFKKHVLCS